MPASDDILIRIAGRDETARLRSAYAAFGYHRETDPKDTVWFAESAGQVVGIVRIAEEQGVLVLRGMRVGESFRRGRIGTRLLYAIAEWLGDRACYCIPYSHLTGFYGQIGFAEIEPEAAPDFLANRLAEYRRSGLDALQMQRPA